MSRLIIIRGNSGSGKTIIAKQLQQAFQPRFVKDLGHGTMLVSQDVIRRDILRAKDGPNNPSIQLIKDTATYGLNIGFDVIIEGILVRDVYGTMLRELSASGTNLARRVHPCLYRVVKVEYLGRSFA